MRKFPKKSISALIITAILGIGQLFWVHIGGDVKSERVIVTKVYDGDTIVAGRGWKKTTIRLIGVDTPETVHPEKPVQFFGPEASDFTKRSLEGKWIRLELEPDRPGGVKDHYNRTLAYVITEEGKNFNLELVRLGYGRAYTRFSFKYMSEFKQAEAAARKAGLGIWAKAKTAGTENPAKQEKIIGNVKSRIYHLPGRPGYARVSEKNRQYFKTEEEAVKAGYRKARN